MDREELRKYDRLEECVAFHGHICPGLVIGYRASKLGMEKLNEVRAEDEELVAIVENDACFVDAVQVLTGCTFGKGNLIYKDYGKMAMTLASRRTGKGFRIILKERSFRSSDHKEHFELIHKVINDQATDEEKRRFWKLHEERSRRLLETKTEELFDVKESDIELPPKARIFPSEPCAVCGEATMKTKMVEVEGRLICKACLEASK
ncbi:MAG: FmdE family protein [Syntrophobacterales bacterium]|nr:FmdE family protein [Syntrophobacterales bacterium]